ncbi:MAG TPA: cyclic nucleotide-binding domain-containing protein [Nocardioides sp.]|nr:cyclic nucleotide-binding domain-containing protein [Nocardioides sp.]
MRLHRDAKADVIRSIPLFADCTTAQLAAIGAVADEIDLPAGKELTVENAVGEEFVAIAGGSAEVRRGSAVLATLGAGDHFGEVALLTGSPRNATVVATTPVHALVIARRDLAVLLSEIPGLRDRLTAALEVRGGAA